MEAIRSAAQRANDTRDRFRHNLFTLRPIICTLSSSLPTMATPSETHLNIDTDTFTTYSDALQAAALTTTRLAATSLPGDLSFHRSIDPALARDVDAFSDRVLALANKLVYIASGKTSRMREEEDVVDEFVRNILDPMEGMLENTDGALDVFLGKRKDPAIHVPAVAVDPHQNKAKACTSIQPFWFH